MPGPFTYTDNTAVKKRAQSHFQFVPCCDNPPASAGGLAVLGAEG